MMTRQQRVTKALQHQAPDLIPHQIDLTSAEHQKVLKYFDNKDFIEKLNNHLAMIGFLADNQELPDRPGHFKDFFGVVWNRTVDRDIGVVEQYQLTDPSLDSWCPPSIDEKSVHDQCQAFMSYPTDQFRVGGIGFSMFERAWTLRGMEYLLTDMLTDADFVEELLDRICEINLTVLDIALQYDFDAIYFGDDWGQQHGMIMGPDHWRRFIKPRVARMYERVRKAGKFVIQHSCGDIQAIFPDLIEIGLSCYQTFQPEIYDIASVKKEYGKDLSFWGGLSTQQMLATASVEEVRRVTIETMHILGDQGGYIAAPTHAVPGDVPAENIAMLLEIFLNQERYL